MITGIERIIIEVPDLKRAEFEYKSLLGENIFGEPLSSVVPFSNSAIELRENSSLQNTKIAGITLLDNSSLIEPNTIFPKPRGLNINRIGKRLFPHEQIKKQGIVGIDHLVLLSNDLDDCIERFGTQGLGIRLALDKTEPKWGGRMLFFRFGKFTLEIIQNSNNNSQEKDRFWGLAYLCSDIKFTVTELQKKGVKYSSIREGRKKGTLVSTIKSHNLGLPTLLLQNT